VKNCYNSPLDSLAASVFILIPCFGTRFNPQRITFGSSYLLGKGGALKDFSCVVYWLSTVTMRIYWFNVRVGEEVAYSLRILIFLRVANDLL